MVIGRKEEDTMVASCQSSQVESSQDEACEEIQRHHLVFPVTSYLADVGILSEKVLIQSGGAER